MSMKDPQLPENESRGLLDEACARNVAVELHYHTAAGELCVARSRLLGQDGDHVFVDSPQSIGSEIELATRQELTVHLNLHDSRYLFESSVVRRKSLLPLNDEKSVVGMVLERPRRIRDGQRRHHFRVSLVAEEKLGIEVRRAGREEHPPWPDATAPMHGALINLSLGGVALRVSMEDGRRLTLDDRIFVRFFLPDDDHDYVMLADIRQLRPVVDHTALRLGVRFRSWPDERDYQHMQQRLQRYITKVQREQLKRAG